MNKKTNLFVCVLVALLINLQCNVSAYAFEEDTVITEEASDKTDLLEEDNAPEVINDEITREDLSLPPFTDTEDDQTL